MSEQPSADPSSPDFVPVCAIGASAGGVGALQTLFRLLPDDLGMAYVVVVHLSPDHPSAMHEILGACTKMSVFQVTDGPTLRANCVYVIAPDSELVIDGNEVKSRPFSDPRSRRAPIDMFFRSIAAGRGDGIAVVLTGAGSDGAVGVRAIKEAGGIVMVQEPAEAGFPSMPQNAIATGVADVVAPLARLAERIVEAALSKAAVRSLDEDDAANDVRRIVGFLRRRTGHDFSGYKRSTVLRRIQRRTQICQIASPADYLLYLRANPEEAKELLSDLLISVTMFFRDPETFTTLNHRVIRPLLESWSKGETEAELRAWVVGCATGEEAYSLAILLLEEAERLKLSVPIQIFATDLDEGALTTAREGRYPRSIEADVSAERLRRFFVDQGTHYRIDRRVRDLVLFATHSVVRDPPFMRLDLITCRNVLIYLERALQQHVNTIFRYGLKPDGYLFLGTAETADTSDNHFAVVDRDARIYRALPARPDFVPAVTAPGIWSAGRPALTENRLATARLNAGEVLGESHAAALETSAPPSALVDSEQVVLHLSPTAGRFILLSAGPLSGRLPSIVRPELRLDLKLALDRAFDGRQPTITRPLDVLMEGDTRRVSLHVAPLPVGKGAAPRAIVYFLDNGPGRTEGAEALPPDELQHLHSELKVAQEAELAGRIRNESAVQELRASNEELQSLNEEYRSTAEELETSKEELQSINEELQTVNAELKSKLGVISAAHNDLQNLTASSEIGTLFLDLDLRIRMFTPPVAELINVAAADVGRPITNFTHRLEYAGFVADVRRVSHDLTPLETEVRTVDGRWFTVRIRPYRTLDGKVEGSVVTFDDNTDRKLAREALRESEEKYRSLFETIDEGFTIIEMVRDDDGRRDFIYREANDAFVRMTGFQPNPGQRARDAMPDIEDDWLDYYDRVASSGIAEEKEGFQVGAARWYRINANRLGGAGSRFLAVVFEDISERKRAEQLLRESESWLAAQKDAFHAAMDDAPLERSLGILAAWVDENAKVQRRCAFYIANEDGNELRHVVGMSDDYADAVDRLAISPESLACGVAVATGEPVITRDVLADPAWQEWTWLATDYGYRSCWSFPVGTATGKLIGSFVQYFPAPHGPTPRDLELATAVTQAAAIILSRHRENAERSRAEAALRESEQRFRALATTGGASIYRMSPDWRQIYQFDSRILLTPVAQPVENRASDYVLPEDRGLVADAVERALSTKSLFEVEHRVKLPDDGIGWLLSRAVPILGADGRITEWFGTVTDVTERREAANKLRASEERFQALFAVSPVPFMVLAPNAPDFTITAANDAYLAATLTTREELIGRKLFDVLTDNPDRPGQLGSEALALSLDRVLTTRRMDAMERVRYDLATPRGGFEPHWWLAINAPLLDASGEVTTIIHQVARVTELHRAEEVEREYQDRQAFLLRLSDALRPLENAADIERTAVNLLGAKLRLSRAFYGMVGEEGDTVRVGHVYTSGMDDNMGGHSLSNYRPGLQAAWQAGRLTVVADSETDPTLDPAARAIYASVSARAAVGVPLVKRGRLAAVLAVNQATPRAWTDQEITLLAEVAERTWMAIERARAEAALLESEARFRTLADTAPALIWQNDAAGGNMFINRYFLDYTGLSAAEISGEKWRALIHPDHADAYVADYMAAVHEQRPFHSRNRIRRSDGAWRWFENYAQPLFDEQGRYDGHVGVSVDVTAITEAELSLRASEQRQQLLIEGVPQLVWRAVDGGQYTWASPQWTEYTGQPERDSHGYGWLEPVHPDDREEVRVAWQNSADRGEFYADYRLHHASEHRYCWFQSRAKPARDDAGEIVEWLGTSTDVDDLRRLQERQGVLVAELQHRTRNLITVVQAVSRQTLRDVASMDEFRERFGDRLSALSRVQGTLSQLSSGQQVTFDGLLKSELAALGAADQKVTLDGPADVPLRSATVQTFSLALHELATNALKYGALSVDGHLTVRWEVTGWSDARLHVDWRETGVDMSQVRDGPRVGGYGRELIEQALPFQLNARTTYEITSEGVHCTIDVPVSPETT